MLSSSCGDRRRLCGSRVDTGVGQGTEHAASDATACDAAACHRQRRTGLRRREARRQHHRAQPRTGPVDARDRSRSDHQQDPRHLDLHHPDRPASSDRPALQYPRLRHQHDHQHPGDGRWRADERSLFPDGRLEPGVEGCDPEHRGDPRRRRLDPVGQHGDGRHRQHHHQGADAHRRLGGCQLRQLQHLQRRSRRQHPLQRPAESRPRLRAPKQLGLQSDALAVPERQPRRDGVEGRQRHLLDLSDAERQPQDSRQGLLPPGL